MSASFEIYRRKNLHSFPEAESYKGMLKRHFFSIHISSYDSAPEVDFQSFYAVVFNLRSFALSHGLLPSTVFNLVLLYVSQHR
jgi:hypothetical protein